MKCPICEEGNLEKKKINESMFGIYLGKFDADVCSECGESFTSSKVTREIEDVAKKKGIWNLGKRTNEYQVFHLFYPIRADRQLLATNLHVLDFLCHSEY